MIYQNTGKQTQLLSEGGVSINALNLAENIIEIKVEQIFEEEMLEVIFQFLQYGNNQNLDN